MPKLDLINLSSEAYDRLPASISTNTELLSKVTELNLANNLFESLPEELIACIALKIVNISSNHLGQLSPVISRWTSLVKLNLSGNRLSSLPEELASCDQLEELNISRNRFKSFPDILLKLRHLKKLEMHYNFLQFLPSQCGDFRRLTEWNLSNNGLVRLPLELLDIATLRTVQLDGNPVAVAEFYTLDDDTQQVIQTYLYTESSSSPARRMRPQPVLAGRAGPRVAIPDYSTEPADHSSATSTDSAEMTSEVASAPTPVAPQQRRPVSATMRSDIASTTATMRTAPSSTRRVRLTDQTMLSALSFSSPRLASRITSKIENALAAHGADSSQDLTDYAYSSFALNVLRTSDERNTSSDLLPPITPTQGSFSAVPPHISSFSAVPHSSTTSHQHSTSSVTKNVPYYSTLAKSYTPVSADAIVRAADLVDDDDVDGAVDAVSFAPSMQSSANTSFSARSAVQSVVPKHGLSAVSRLQSRTKKLHESLRAFEREVSDIATTPKSAIRRAASPSRTHQPPQPTPSSYELPEQISFRAAEFNQSALSGSPKGLQNRLNVSVTDMIADEADRLSDDDGHQHDASALRILDDSVAAISDHTVGLADTASAYRESSANGDSNESVVDFQLQQQEQRTTSLTEKLAETQRQLALLRDRMVREERSAGKSLDGGAEFRMHSPVYSSARSSPGSRYGSRPSQPLSSRIPISQMSFAPSPRRTYSAREQPSSPQQVDAEVQPAVQPAANASELGDSVPTAGSLDQSTNTEEDLIFEEILPQQSQKGDDLSPQQPTTSVAVVPSDVAGADAAAADEEALLNELLESDVSRTSGPVKPHTNTSLMNAFANEIEWSVDHDERASVTLSHIAADDDDVFSTSQRPQRTIVPSSAIAVNDSVVDEELALGLNASTASL